MFRRAPDEARWSEALVAHREAMRSYLSAAAAVPEERWLEPLAPGKWSPAEVTEHVRLVYAQLVSELTGGQGVAIRVRWPLRSWIRWIYLGRILRTGEFPAGARSPREARPGEVSADRQAAAQGLETAAESFERELAARRGLPATRLTHHIFGRLSPWTGLLLCTVHTRHHGRQLEALGGGPWS